LATGGGLVSTTTSLTTSSLTFFPLAGFLSSFLGPFLSFPPCALARASSSLYFLETLGSLINFSSSSFNYSPFIFFCNN